MIVDDCTDAIHEEKYLVRTPISKAHTHSKKLHANLVFDCFHNGKPSFVR